MDCAAAADLAVGCYLNYCSMGFVVVVVEVDLVVRESSVAVGCLAVKIVVVGVAITVAYCC